MFTQKYPTETFDQALWKQFWHRNQRYHTFCLPCIADKRDHDRKLNILKNKRDIQENAALNWGAIILKDASEDIMKNWYRTAHDNIFGPNGRSRMQHSIDISDDDEDDFSQRRWIQQPREVTTSTSSIAVFWLRTARARLQRDRTINASTRRR
jgi:hypothetical protein